MSTLSTAAVAGLAFIATWIVVGLLLGGEASDSQLLAGVVGGIAFATTYYFLGRRRRGSNRR